MCVLFWCSDLVKIHCRRLGHVYDLCFVDSISSCCSTVWLCLYLQSTQVRRQEIVFMAYDVLKVYVNNISDRSVRWFILHKLRNSATDLCQCSTTSWVGKFDLSLTDSCSMYCFASCLRHSHLLFIDRTLFLC